MNRSDVANTLSEVFDPELGLDVVSLGLIYDIQVQPNGLEVAMTMTSISCPMAEAILEAAGRALARVAPEARVCINPVFDPPWSPEMLTDEARAWLGIPPRVRSGA